VARASGTGGVEPVLERATITRIGRGVDDTGLLSGPGMAATLDTLRAFVDQAREAGAREVSAIGTSALRDARNSDAFLGPAEAILGAPVEVVTGDREARLTFTGATQGLDLGGADTSVVDIGGGSTEVVRGRGGRVDRAVSLDVGSVRLTERHIRHDPPQADELARVSGEACRALQDGAPFVGAPLVGIAGTVTTLVAIHRRVDPYDPRRIHGAILERASLEALVQHLAALPTAARARLPGLDAARADVIVAGALILQAAMHQAGADRVIASHGGVRYGRAAEMLAPSPP
jgi:exopolyphosphatase / guanosine-5'-triphosphate,3'-diphosphate pyrophosphatase